MALLIPLAVGIQSHDDRVIESPDNGTEGEFEWLIRPREDEVISGVHILLPFPFGPADFGNVVLPQNWAWQVGQPESMGSVSPDPITITWSGGEGTCFSFYSGAHGQPLPNDGETQTKFGFTMPVPKLMEAGGVSRQSLVLTRDGDGDLAWEVFHATDVTVPGHDRDVEGVLSGVSPGGCACARF